MIEDEFDKYMVEDVIPSVIAYYIKVYYDEKVIVHLIIMLILL